MTWTLKTSLTYSPMIRVLEGEVTKQIAQSTLSLETS